MAADLAISSLFPAAVSPRDTSIVSKAKDGFGEMLSSALDQVNTLQLKGDQAIEQMHSGKVENLHEVMIAVEQADISLRMLVQMRNKAQTAYEEIMRMQV